MKPVRFFDGKSIHPYQAQLSIKAQLLCITYQEGEEEITQRWLHSSLELLEIPHHGKPAVIGSKNVKGARIIIHDLDLYNQIQPLIPYKNIKHAAIHHPWRFVGWLIFGSAMVFGFMLWGILAFSPLFAKHIPYSWDRAFGEFVIEAVVNSFKETSTDNQECVLPQGKLALQKMVDRLDKAANLEHPIDVRVIDFKQQPNAFTAPGFHIVIMSPLLDMTDTPEELAGVLAHEMGHAIEHHPTAGVIRLLGVKLLIFATFGPSYDLGGDLLNLKYNRDNEEEADNIAVNILNQAKIDVNGLVSFFKKISQSEYHFPLKEFLSTHPDTLERTKHIESKLEQTATVPILTTKEWRDLKNICKKKVPLTFKAQPDKKPPS